jgi:hypothetical protein
LVEWGVEYFGEKIREPFDRRPRDRPPLTLWLRCATLANAQTHVIIWADSSNPIYRGELGDA